MPLVAPLSTALSLPGQGVRPPPLPASAFPLVQLLTPIQIAQICQAHNAQPAYSSNPVNPLTAGTYVYPSNLPERSYQREIVQTAFLSNTLVCLPTGLGKTLIAAVVMYNFYRWFQTGKILFVAPTRPLVLQQKEACCNLMGIDESHTHLCIGGKEDTHARRQMWQSPEVRVIFATPQSITSDVQKGICPLGQLVCVVVDECHKATGKYSYVEIIKQIKISGHGCRVLGLSATPGKDLYAVRELCTNLNVSKIELRDESDPDIKPHLHAREIEMVLVRQTGGVAQLMELLYDTVRPALRKLCSYQIGLVETDPSRATVISINMATTKVQKEAAAYGDSLYTIMGELGAMRKILTVRDKLKSHGVKLCYDKLRETILGDHRGYVESKGEVKAPSNALIALRKDPAFKKFLAQLEVDVRIQDGSMLDIEPPLQPGAVGYSDSSAAAAAASSSSTSALPPHLQSLSLRHPKMSALLELVASHFAKLEQKERWMAAVGETNEEEEESDDEDEPILGGGKAPHLVFRGSKSSSNIIIFTEFRDSVGEIVDHLQRIGPQVRASRFIGQAKKGMNQKEQAEVLNKFRDGTFNVM